MPGGCVTGSLPQLKNSGKPPSSTAPLKPAGIPAEGAGTADGVGARGAWIAKGGGRSGSDSRGRGQEGFGRQGAWAGGARASGGVGRRVGQQREGPGRIQTAGNVGRRGAGCTGHGQEGHELQEAWAGMGTGCKGCGQEGSGPHRQEPLLSHKRSTGDSTRSHAAEQRRKNNDP